MNVHGKCHCGQIAYEAEIDPQNVSMCHCTDCQALCGSPFRVSVAARHDSFKLLAGRPQTYVKVSEDGTKRVQAFCPSCGSPIYASGVETQPTYNLRWGSIVERAQLEPRKQIWCRSAQPWVGRVDGISPRLETD